LYPNAGKNIQCIIPNIKSAAIGICSAVIHLGE